MDSQQHWYSLEHLTEFSSEQEKKWLAMLGPLLTIPSLTKGLEALDADFSVNLMSLAATDEYYSEQTLKPQQVCRKVQLQLSGVPVIYAESHCSPTAAHWVDYLNCGVSSLGRRLFSSKVNLERSPFSYAFFPAKALSAVVGVATDDPTVIIGARRSSFIHNGDVLWITEWYLPALIQKIIANAAQGQ